MFVSILVDWGWNAHMYIYISCIHIFMLSHSTEISLQTLQALHAASGFHSFPLAVEENIKIHHFCPCTFWNHQRFLIPPRSGERSDLFWLVMESWSWLSLLGKVACWSSVTIFASPNSGAAMNHHSRCSIDWLIDWRHLMIGWWWKMVDSSWWMMGQMGQNRLCFGKAVKCVSGNSEKRNVERNVSFLSMVLRKDR